MLRKRARGAVWQYALFRWESAVVVAGAILLTALWRRPFGLAWWPVWSWPLLGLLAWGALVCSTLTDAQVEARIVAQLFREECDPFRLRDPALRATVEAALDCLLRCDERARQQRPGPWRDWLEGTGDQLADWVGGVYRAAVWLDTHRSDALLTQERKRTPEEIEELAARRRLESNPAAQRKLDEALESKGRRWQELRALEAQMAQVEMELQQSSAALAAVCAQLQALDAQSLASDRPAHLRAEIQEQVARLESLAR